MSASGMLFLGIMLMILSAVIYVALGPDRSNDTED